MEASDTTTQAPKPRQFCSRCLRTTTAYTTEYFDGGRRFHRCIDTEACDAARAAAERS